jgi:hypothetical protein
MVKGLFNLSEILIWNVSLARKHVFGSAGTVAGMG